MNTLTQRHGALWLEGSVLRSLHRPLSGHRDHPLPRKRMPVYRRLSEISADNSFRTPGLPHPFRTIAL